MYYNTLCLHCVQGIGKELGCVEIPGGGNGMSGIKDKSNPLLSQAQQNEGIE